jgi:hypothetical protein
MPGAQQLWELQAKKPKAPKAEGEKAAAKPKTPKATKPKALKVKVGITAKILAAGSISWSQRRG